MFKTLLIEGMHCSHCVGLVNIELYQIEDVMDVKVDIKKSNAIVQIKKPVPIDVFKKAIESAGYRLIRII